MRINRVVDYIDAHLDEEHTLKNLSQVTHFSPFHFHRIFRVLTGETSVKMVSEGIFSPNGY
jgi:AraC family transcriptional regulator